MRDRLPLREDLGEVLRPEHVPQRRRRQKARRVTGRRRQSHDSHAGPENITWYDEFVIVNDCHGHGHNTGWSVWSDSRLG